MIMHLLILRAVVPDWGQGNGFDQFIQINVIISMWSYQCYQIIIINFHFTPTQISDQNMSYLLPYFEQVYSDILR